MMDLNLSQTASVIVVGGQSYIIQNDANILNSEPNIIGGNLPSLQPNNFAFNLQKDTNLSTNPQIVAILDENQSQTFEITSEQAAELGLQFDRNDLSKKKLILSSGLTNPQNPPNLFNTNFNLSIVNSPAVTSSSNDTQFLESQFVDTPKKFTLEPTIMCNDTPVMTPSLQTSDCTNPFLMQLDDKVNTPSPSNSQLSEPVGELSQPVQNDLLSPESSVYDSMFLKEPYDDLCATSSLSDVIDEKIDDTEKLLLLKKKKVPSKKSWDLGVTDVRKNLKNLSRVPSAEKDGGVDSTVDIGVSSVLSRDTNGNNAICSKSLDLTSNILESPLQTTPNTTDDLSQNAQSALKDAKKFKPTLNTAKKQSKQENDERLDVTVNAQSLTKEQLKQIAQVFSKKHIMLDTKAPSRNVLYDPETNTRIICRVVYPEDLCKERIIEPLVAELEKKDLELHKNNAKKRGRRSKFKEDDKTSPPNKSESKAASSSGESKKADETDHSLEKVPVQISRTTRSGRVSRPPRHMEGLSPEDAAPTPFQSVSAQPPPVPKTFECLPDVGKKRNVSAEFKCPTCDKVYLGQTKMAMHFEKNPTHRNLEKWNEKILKSLKKTDDPANKSGEAGSKPKYGPGKKKGKKRQTYEQCKILLKRALEDCSKADVAVLAGPIVASVLSVWEFLVLRSAKMKLENENHVLALLRELKSLLNHIKSSADALISPVNCSPLDPQIETTNQIEIRDDATSHVLGLPYGKYAVNNNYENSWLKSFSERNKKLIESDSADLKRSKPETEDLNLWPTNDLPSQLPPPPPLTESENDLNASNLLLTENTHTTTYIDEIMSQRLENLRTQQQNELNDCFSSVDDLINNFSVSMGKTTKNESLYAMDKCDTSLDLNFVNFPRGNDIISDFGVISSLNDEQRNLNFDSGSAAVGFVDDAALYENMSFNNSDVMNNVSSSTEDLMKSLVNFELRPSDSGLSFDAMNQFSPVVMHDDNVSASHAGEFQVDTSFDRTVEQISNLVSSQSAKVSLKEDDLDFVHSLDCLNPSI